MINVILVDDEPIALQHLANLIGKHTPQLSIQGMASSVEKGIGLIREMKPEIVFLDIELAGHNSFELLEKVQEFEFEKIFVTAHEKFGIQAIKHNASDYILKPIDKEELIEAIEKVSARVYAKRLTTNRPQYEVQSTLHNDRISLPTIDGLIFVDIHKIMYCESEGRYTRFYLAGDDRKILISKNIGEYEVLLPHRLFVRIHNHYIVNLKYVDKYVKGRGGYVVISNGTTLEVSARKKEGFIGRIEG